MIKRQNGARTFFDRIGLLNRNHFFFDRHKKRITNLIESLHRLLNLRILQLNSIRALFEQSHSILNTTNPELKTFYFWSTKNKLKNKLKNIENVVFCTKFGTKMSFWMAAYHFKASEFRNWRAFDFFNYSFLNRPWNAEI